jgi:hypothetical protein
MVRRLLQPFLTACVAYTSHYTVTKVYSAICVPDGLWGFVQGSFTTGSPVCSAMFSTMSATQITYNTMIAFIVSHLLVDAVFFSKGSKESQQSSEQDTVQHAE